MPFPAPFPKLGPLRWTVALITAILAEVPAAADDVPPLCRGDAIATSGVARVLDGRTIVLADGREVRLAGIEVPPLSGDDAVADAGDRAKTALEALVSNQEVILRRVAASNDRYGRIVAQVFAAPDRWVQAEMVASGHALASANGVFAACAAALLRQERAAREAKLGLWAEPYYEIARAGDHAAVAAERGRFTLVEGKVLSVRESGATIYVNFGRRWSEDFTATIAKRNARAFAAAGLEPKKLQGRLVRIRGWIEERGGPWIDVRRPEQIEVVETDAK